MTLRRPQGLALIVGLYLATLAARTGGSAMPKEDNDYRILTC